MAYKKNLKKLQQAIIKLEQIKPQTNVQTTTTNTGNSRT
jgi:hypothetical protein